jgi:glucosyl-dolichyl phosphate glucuronosyltransferase
MDVSVILCTWNRSKTLAVVLASLEASVVPESVEWEVLVVDNNSTDDTRAVCESVAKRNPGRFRYFFEAKQGKSNALNTGIREASGKILAFTDDDVTVHQDWIAQTFDAFQQFDCSGIGGRIVPVWNCEQPAWVVFDGPYRHAAIGGIVHFEKGDAPVELNVTATGANMAIRREIVQKYGPFRTDLSGNHADKRRLSDLLGGEDTEYCRRLMRAGERFMYAPRAIVYHPVEQHRTTRKYLQSFSFQYGRWVARMGGMAEGMKTLFGFPRYLYPLALNFLLKWVFSAGVQRRFFYRLEFFQILGQMEESKRLLRTVPASQPANGLKSVG